MKGLRVIKMKKQIEELGAEIFQHCSAGLFEDEAAQIAEFVINKQSYRKASEVAAEIFAEIEEGVKAAVSALQFENNPIHRQVKHETYSSFMRFVKIVEKKYIGEDTNVRTNSEEGK